MDWPSVANLLADRGGRAMILLDRASKIVLFNGAMEQVLGWPREDVVGRSWLEACVPPERVRATKRSLEQALDGALQKHEGEVLTRDGRRLWCRLRLTLVGRRREPGLLMTLDSARPTDGADVPLSGRDLDYDVSANLSEFGVVRRIAGIGDSLLQSPPPSGRRCFELLHDRQSPCPDCPVLLGARGAWPQTTVRRPGNEGERYEVVTAEPTGHDLVRLRVRMVDPRVLGAIQRARIDSIAERAGLSEREKRVLDNLLLGRSLDDIAETLALSRRTVKFHQANLLQKLGVDSRVDLIRIIGF
jgi:PAS domain S-box-containing protein